MTVELTKLAAEEIKRVLQEQDLPESTALRVGVAGGGCSGFQYQLEFEETVDEKADFVREMHGIRVAIDKKSLLMLEGTEIDFHNGLDRRGFVFNNPNAVRSCGCGNSFQA